MKLAGLALCLCASVAVAGPDASKRPVPRPATAPVAVDTEQSGVIRQPVRDGADGAGEAPAGRGVGLGLSLRPVLRSRKIERAAAERKKLRARGAVCGDPAIQGEEIGRVAGKINGCGIESAVRVRSVAGVKLSQSSVMECRTAKALKTWVNRSAKPALSRKGGGLSGLRVAAHYACRTRNNQKGTKISEHGKGRAIDISGFRLKDGSVVSVLKGWKGRTTGKEMRQMHKGACGPFGTVLGPNANKFHLDHFHFDTARYRSGTYCK